MNSCHAVEVLPPFIFTEHPSALPRDLGAHAVLGHPLLCAGLYFVRNRLSGTPADRSEEKKDDQMHQHAAFCSVWSMEDRFHRCHNM